MTYTVRDEGGVAVLGVDADTELDLFEVTAYAVFDLGFVLDDVTPTYSRPIVAPGDSLDDLLANWLTELLAASMDASLAFVMFNVDRLEEGGLQGWASGLPLSEVARRSKPVEAIEAASVWHDRDGRTSAEVRVRRQPRLRIV